MKYLFIQSLVLLSVAICRPSSAALQIENAGVTNISYTTANLNALLVSTNATNPVITFFYGFSDGLTNPSVWSCSNVYGAAGTGLVSVAVSNLTPASLYYYRAYATETTNSAWASGSSNFVTRAGAPVVSNPPPEYGRAVMATSTGYILFPTNPAVFNFTIGGVTRTNWPEHGTGDVSTWSFYPATQTVDIAGQGIKFGGVTRTNWPVDATEVAGSNAALGIRVGALEDTVSNLQDATSNNLAPNWSGHSATQAVDFPFGLKLGGATRTNWPSVDASEWSVYQASQDVDISGFILYNVGGLELGGVYRATWPSDPTNWATVLPTTNIDLNGRVISNGTFAGTIPALANYAPIIHGHTNYMTNAATWSAHDAAQTVNMANHGLANVGFMSLGGVTRTTWPLGADEYWVTNLLVSGSNLDFGFLTNASMLGIWTNRNITVCGKDSWSSTNGLFWVAFNTNANANPAPDVWQLSWAHGGCNYFLYYNTNAVPTGSFLAATSYVTGTPVVAVSLALGYGVHVSDNDAASWRQAAADASYSTSQIPNIQSQISTNASNLVTHIADTNNPHSVTPGQIGAANTGAVYTVQTNLDAHIANTNNPHGVTAAQIGAVSTNQVITWIKISSVLTNLNIVGATGAPIPNITGVYTQVEDYYGLPAWSNSLNGYLSKMGGLGLDARTICTNNAVNGDSPVWYRGAGIYSPTGIYHVALSATGDLVVSYSYVTNTAIFTLGPDPTNSLFELKRNGILLGSFDSNGNFYAPSIQLGTNPPITNWPAGPAGTGTVATVGTYPVFKLDIGNVDGNWTDFEIKATTNNFATLLYYFKSWTAQSGTNTDTNAYVYFTDDYVSDVRQWWKKTNNIPVSAHLASTNSVVDSVCFYPSHDCAWSNWMYATNTHLIWSWVRVDDLGFQNNLTGTKQHWNAIRPEAWEVERTVP